MSGHTPGPWRWEPVPWGHHIHLTPPDYRVSKERHVESHLVIEYEHSLEPEDGDQYREAEANASLIAAAPALLQACKDLWGYLYATNNPGSLPQFCRDAETTIAQAEGREP